MSLEKCQKYLHKLSNTHVTDEKFGLYLTKLNYWYEQVGGDAVIRDTQKDCIKKVAKDRKIAEDIAKTVCKQDVNGKWCDVLADFDKNGKNYGDEKICCDKSIIGHKGVRKTGVTFIGYKCT